MHETKKQKEGKEGTGRLDEVLVLQGLCESRTQAKALIMAGQVRCKEQVLDKAAQKVALNAPLSLQASKRFVSRAGEKLDAFLTALNLSVSGLSILDIGASTGGFTDCLLQRGALRATCIDVGYGQLHAKLRQDPRVLNKERLNARHLKASDLPQPQYDFVVMDLSFISLTKVLPVAWGLVAPQGHVVALIKPQFEVNKIEAARHKGIIRDPALHERVLTEMRKFVHEALIGSHLKAISPSSIPGTDGNQEFLMALQKE